MPKERFFMQKYDVIIIGAGPGGIFSAFELRDSGKSIAVFESGNELSKRSCPIEKLRPA